MCERSPSRAFRLTISCLALSATFAFPQTSAANTKAPPQPEWEKVCGPVQDGRECHISRGRLGATGKPIAKLMVIERGEKKLIQVAVPPVAMIQPGVRLKIDSSDPVGIQYVVCTPKECLALGEINADFIGRLKRGGTLTIAALHPEGKPLTFDISLAGFTKAYEGKGNDLGNAQEREQALTEQLQRNAEDARQQLLKAQEQARVQ